MSTDTTLTTDSNDDGLTIGAATPEAISEPPRRRPNPIIFLGLGIALVAMGQEFIEDGLREIQRNGGRLPGAAFPILPAQRVARTLAKADH